MKGMYNGSYMRAFRIVSPVQVKNYHLSKDALKRLAWIDWYVSHRRNAQATCRHFGLSKSVFYRWLKRFNRSNLTTLEFNTKTRRPKKLRTMITPRWIIDRVYTIREADLEKSKYEIQAELAEEGIVLGYNTIQKIINRHPELANTQHRMKVRKHRNYSIARIKAARELREKYLGSLVQIDTKHLYILGKRFYLFAAIDCKSRYGFVWCYQSIASSCAADFLQKVGTFFPFPLLAINTDNGSEYLLNFHKACEEKGITHYFTYPHTPQMNGRVERFIQTVEYEFFNYQDDLLPEITEINQRCLIFNEKYNTRRYNQALGYRTPLWYVTKLLAERGG